MGTIIVGIVLVALLGFAIYRIVKNRGKCGGCSGCETGAGCPSNQPEEK